MIAESERDRDLKKAAYAIETLTKKAEADLAYSLQEAVVKQKLKEEKKSMSKEAKPFFLYVNLQGKGCSAYRSRPRLSSCATRCAFTILMECVERHGKPL